MELQRRPGQARPVVLVFARQHDRGPVKTRLAAEVGAARAREIYRNLAERVWGGLEDAAWDRWLMVEPPEAIETARAWLPGAARVCGQSPGDLGARMAGGVREAFARGASAALVVGADAPAVDATCVAAAIRRLDGCDLVLVPALDGGYALIGMRRLHESLFTGVAWGSTRVLEQTRERAQAAGLRWEELDPVRDVDTLADLEALPHEIEKELGRPRSHRGSAP